MKGSREIFTALKSQLGEYTPPLAARSAGEGDYHLWSVKDLVIDGRKRNEVYFAGLTVRKDYVGLYFMPVYAEPGMKALFSPRLVRLLKGKSCFHIKELDDGLAGEVRQVLKRGYQAYQERGWV